MTEETTGLVLEHLRKIREIQESMKQDIHDVKLRMSSTERHLGEIQMQVGGLNSRMDRIDERLSRIERRLDLVDA
jgi:chromosome segregation ATPase